MEHAQGPDHRQPELQVGVRPCGVQGPQAGRAVHRAGQNVVGEDTTLRALGALAQQASLARFLQELERLHVSALAALLMRSNHGSG